MRYSGETYAGGARFELSLVFEQAAAAGNAYSLSLEARWEPTAAQDDPVRRSAQGWMDLWTSPWALTEGSTSIHPMADDPHAVQDRADAADAARYRHLAEAAVAEDRALDTAESVQQAVLAALREGHSYRRSDKETSTDLFWRNGQYVRDDQGDNPGYVIYRTEADALRGLRQLADWDLQRRAGPRTRGDREAWILILRRLTSLPRGPA